MKLLPAALASLLLLTACGGGGLSKQNENAFVSGSGVAVYVKAAERKPAPAISGMTLSGKTEALTLNKVTVLNVWASWCSPCRAEAPLLQDFSQKYPDVQFAGILTRDNLTAAKSFVDRFKLTYPTFTDDAVLTSFRGSLLPNAIPTTLIIDASGYVAARVSGAITVGLLTDLITKVSKDPHHA
ncbi:MAG: TlpA disulfide reductase family protein [Actinomycetes bacterium]